MKTTVKFGSSRSAVIAPQKPGGAGIVSMQFNDGNGGFQLSLTADQCGAFMFALEMAAEAHQAACNREAVAA